MVYTNDEITDKEFLTWIHERLENVYGENPNVAHMRRLRKIIEGTEGCDQGDSKKKHGSLMSRAGDNFKIFQEAVKMNEKNWRGM